MSWMSILIRQRVEVKLTAVCWCSKHCTVRKNHVITRTETEPNLKNQFRTSPLTAAICDRRQSMIDRQDKSTSSLSFLCCRRGLKLWNSSAGTSAPQPDLSTAAVSKATETHLFVAAWLRRLMTCFFQRRIEIGLSLHTYYSVQTATF